MSASAQGVAALWGDRAPLIAVIHLPALPGAPRWSGSMNEIVDRAAAGAEAVTEAGFDGVIVENFMDAPFFRGRVPAETTAAMVRAVSAARAATELPVGVNVLRNDAHAALAVATATGAHFVRVNVHTGSMWTDQGLVEGRAAETLRTRAALAPTVEILADVHVKHATPPAGSVLEDAARDAWQRGLADALIVSGVGTGRATAVADVSSVKQAVPAATVLVGSGLAIENARALLTHADGAIVGSAIMAGGRAGGAIDKDRTRALVDAARS